MIIREVEHPTWRDLSLILQTPFRKKSLEPNPVLENLRMVGSGKGALALALGFLRYKNIFSDKLSEILVPDWLGYWVYNQVQEFAFPAKQLSSRTKAILVYHQYGFPQRMELILEFAQKNQLVIIEDCAHALAGTYEGRPLGQFGDFAIYSFSKFMFCFPLGGIRTTYADFEAYAAEHISKTPWWISTSKDLIKGLTELSASWSLPKSDELRTALASIGYALYSKALKPGKRATALMRAKINHEIAVRKARYRHFREKTDHLGICNHLPFEGVVPYVIPIRISKDQQNVLVNNLRKLGVQSGIYQFDINRNQLNPCFEPTVWIPCHAQINDLQFDRMIDTIISCVGEHTYKQEMVYAHD